MRGDDFKLWMMVEVPSNVIILDKFIDVGIDGISIGSNDLTQLMLGIDRDNEALADTFDERNQAVMTALETAVTGARRRGITVVDLRPGALRLPGAHGEARRVGHHERQRQPGHDRPDAEDHRRRGGEAGARAEVALAKDRPFNGRGRSCRARFVQSTGWISTRFANGWRRPRSDSARSLRRPRTATAAASPRSPRRCGPNTSATATASSTRRRSDG